MSARLNPALQPFLKLFSSLLLLLVVAHAAAVSVVVQPFASQDVLLGVAVADEVAHSLGDRATVFGPDVAPGVIPPLVAEGGFVSLSRVVGAERFAGEAGADLTRSGAGVDIAVTGSIQLRDSGYTLLLSVAHPGGLTTAEIAADTATPERLAVLAGALVDTIIDRQLPEAPEGGAQPHVAPAMTGSFDDAYGGYVRAVALVGAGLLDDALLELEALAGTTGAPERAAALAADLRLVLGRSGAEPTAGDHDGTAAEPARLARRALLSISAAEVDVATSSQLFDAMKEATGLPLADAWRGVLAASVNDRSGAQAALAEAATGFSYGQVVNLSFLASRGASLDVATLDQIIAGGQSSGSAALLGASVVAGLVEDTPREIESLTALSRASPFLTYPLEQLSYLYFDADDALAAAEVLTVATELDPDSSLYWTNLGWAYYLLGSYEQSEDASTRALELDGTQEVAAYNLGLVRATHGRLEEALEAYDRALRLDPAVNDEAVEDLENARELFPKVAAIDYSLGLLYEAEGRRSDARSAFRRYLRLAAEDEPAHLIERASERLAALSAPLPPLEVSGELSLNLGQRGLAGDVFHPGDPVYPTFELTTPGDQLPTLITVTAELWPAAVAAEPETAGDAVEVEPLATVATDIEIPQGAVGYVVDVLELALPEDLDAGEYRVEVVADGGEEQRVELAAEITVEGEPVLLRRLLGRGLVMTSFVDGGALYGADDLAHPDDLLEILLSDLNASAAAADDALPEVTQGRFAGLGGGELFTTSTAADVVDFLEYLLGSGSRDARFAFVDAYAQWALDGAPAAEE